MFTDSTWVETTISSPIMLVLLISSVATFGIAIERAYYYWKRSGNPHATLMEAMREVGARRFDKGIAVCESCAHPLGSVAAEVLRTLSAPAHHAEEKLQVALSEQKLLLERNLGFLGTMAAIAPLIGLLGTVWGIMRAFGDMARVGSAAPSVVAAGVAEALITTAAGLLIAVPAVMLYNHLTRRMNVMLIVAENSARALRDAALQATREMPTARHLPHSSSTVDEEAEVRIAELATVR
jgi:biopolymer transport protein ExbB